MKTYQITDKARRQLEEDLKIVNRASDLLGVDVEIMFTRAQDEIGPNTRLPLVLLQILSSEFPKIFYNRALHFEEITSDNLDDILSDEQIEFLMEEGFMEMVEDNDEELILTIDEAFENYKEIFNVEYLKEKVTGFPEKVKEEIMVEVDKADEDRDYPTYLHIRGIVLRQIEVVSARIIKIKDE